MTPRLMTKDDINITTLSCLPCGDKTVMMPQVMHSRVNNSVPQIKALMTGSTIGGQRKETKYTRRPHAVTAEVWINGVEVVKITMTGNAILASNSTIRVSKRESALGC